MLPRLLAFLLCTVICLRSSAQQALQSAALRIRFVPVMNGRPLSLYEGTATDSLRITTFRCYVSGITLKNGNAQVLQDTSPAHLLDAAEPASFVVVLPLRPEQRYDNLSFSLGVDSVTSCSGAQGGDLDPAKGMYWAWQSGYINMKLEGISPLSIARKHEFHFHLGGYDRPFAAIQQIQLHVVPAPELVVKIELSAFLKAINLKAENAVMVPGQRAFELSQQAAKIFVVE